MSIKGAVGSASIEDNMEALDLDNVDWLSRSRWPPSRRKTGANPFPHLPLTFRLASLFLRFPAQNLLFCTYMCTRGCVGV